MATSPSMFGARVAHRDLPAAYPLAKMRPTTTAAPAMGSHGFSYTFTAYRSGVMAEHRPMPLVGGGGTPTLGLVASSWSRLTRLAASNRHGSSTTFFVADKTSVKPPSA